MATIVTKRMPKELLQSTGFLLKRLGMNIKERSYTAFEPTGFTPFHHGVLSLLDEGARKTQAEIADALGYDRSQLVGILDDLQERGLAERERQPIEREPRARGALDGREHLVDVQAGADRAGDGLSLIHI